MVWVFFVILAVGLLFSTQVENLHSNFTLGNDVEKFPLRFAQMEINLHKWKLISICANQFPRVEIEMHLCKSISTGWKLKCICANQFPPGGNDFHSTHAPFSQSNACPITNSTVMSTVSRYSTAVSFLEISPNIVSATSVTLDCHTGPVTSGILLYDV